MRLNIQPKPYAKAEVDLERFKSDLSKHWDMERAIKDSTKIIRKDIDAVTDEVLKNLIWGVLDWAGIMDVLGTTPETHMKIGFHFVEYTDWKKLYPGVKSDEGWEFIEHNESGHATFLIQSLVKNPNFDLKGFIKSGHFQYASTDSMKVGWCVK